MSFQLYAMKYGETLIPESMAFAHGDKYKPVPISLLYYLAIDDGKVSLIDVGCDRLPGFTLSNFVRPTELLGELGLAPEDVGDVIITHAHDDHIGAAKYYGGAKFHIQESEYAAGRAYLPNGARIELFDETSDAAGFHIIRIGGHTNGSCIAERSVNGRKYVICGDECYVPECLLERRPTGASQNPERSRRFIETYSAPEYATLLLHDISVLRGRSGVELVASDD